MKTIEHERRDWIMIPVILLIGFLCVIVAGQWALRSSPSWKLNADMNSNLDPNRDFLTRRPSGFIEPVDPSILTAPVWIDLFLTPGASFSTGTPFPQATITSSFTTSTIPQTPFQTSTSISIASATNTNVVIASPTNTFVYYPPTSSSTSQPNPTATSTVSPIYTFTPTATGASPGTPTPTATPSLTPTNSPTSTATNTPTDTQTPTATPTAACSTTIIVTGSGSYAKPAGLTCFQYTDTFANGSVFQITSTGVAGIVSGSICPGKAIGDGSTIDYGVAQSGGVMILMIMGSAGTVDINISDWTTYPACP